MINGEGTIMLPMKNRRLKNRAKIKIDAKTILNYWKEHPEFIGYDSTFETDNRIENAIRKARSLGLTRVRKNTWRSFKKWLESKDRKTYDTLISDYTKDRENKIKSLEYVSLAVFSKTAHKLFSEDMPISKDMPIIDSLICDRYGKKNIAKIKDNIVKECSAKENELKLICKILSKNGLKIKPLRAWDILVWSAIKNKGD